MPSTTTEQTRFVGEWAAKFGITPGDAGPGPFAIERDGERLVFSTDRRVLVAEVSDAPAAPAPEKWASIFATIPDGRELGQLPAADIRAWIGEVPGPTEGPCGACRGRGYYEHNCDCEFCTRDLEDEECEECDGTGRIAREPAQRVGLISGGIFDRNIFARIPLEVADSYAVRLEKWAMGYWVRLLAPGVFFLAVGLNPRALAETDGPELMCEPAGDAPQPATASTLDTEVERGG